MREYLQITPKPALILHSHDPSQLRLGSKAERRLVRKIGLYIVPTVALLYLFCFIDRANMGRSIFLQTDKYSHEQETQDW